MKRRCLALALIAWKTRVNALMGAWKTRVNALIVLAALVLHAGGALAQSYPSKPIRIVVPFVAGGAVDQLARMVGAKVSEQLGQPVIVENRPGAGGNVAADTVAKSPPDGYTILQNTNGQAISPAIYRSLPFDVVKDFIPVTQLVASQLVLAASPKLEATSVKELIALAKAKPGGLNYGMTGAGNPLQLTMEMFKTAAGVDIQAVPYRGDAAIFPALITGEVQVAVVPMATSLGHVRAGSVRALAVGGARRSAALPDVPTVAESGLAGFESTSWQGWFVPANTPGEIVGIIQRAAAKALASPDLLEQLRVTGNEAVGSAPEAFAAVFKGDLVKFAKVVKEAHIPAQD
jgi:tripartite-type tricarboxylate transporter receptor subunit TctC